MELLTLLFYISGGLIFLAGLLTLLYWPLALLFEIFAAKRKKSEAYAPPVTVVVPAYNEELVIDNCVTSILASDYPDLELILVDDGSSDGTLKRMQHYRELRAVTVLSQGNGGKAAALNRGLKHASGEIILCVDADGVFRADTVQKMVEPFRDTRVGAVCGNDSPVNLNSAQTRLLSILSRVGTGFVRRALSLINTLPIVAGNSGAFRRETLQETGPFLDGFIGEDLELTWRVHRAGYKVKFQPRAVIYAEVPSTLRGLWKQRVRWARGLLQTAKLHTSMLFRPRYGLFGFFLPLNLLRMIAVPVLQLVSIALLATLLLLGHNPLSTEILAIVAWLGLGIALATTVFAIALDRAWRDLAYLYVLPLWVPYSIMMSAIMGWAIALELRGGEAKWHKLDRTGVVSRRGVITE